MKKAEARTLFLEKRRSLSQEDGHTLDLAILERFKELNFEGINFIHLFLPIRAKHEINTRFLADWIRKNHPEIKLVLSRSDLQNYTLSHIIWKPDTFLIENPWGITEPQSGEAVEAEKLDLVLVPLLALDENGHRVGYGKGFYDRFLAECRPDARKIGLSYFEPIPKIEDAEPLDMPLNACITPNKIWNF